MLEALLQLIGEFLLQLLAEVLIEVGLHALTEPFRREPNPWVAGVGYAAFGAALGALSLLVVQRHLTPDAWRVANLVVTPAALGFVMARFGMWREQRGDPVFRIDRFSFAYLFALSFALVRFVYAQ